MFLIYINNLSGNLSSKARLFANDTSLFNVAHGLITSEDELKNDLKKVSNWAFQWKMNFNPDPRKQAQEVIFSRKLKKIAHPSLVFNNVKFANVNLKNTYNHFDDILRLFDVLLIFFSPQVKRCTIITCKHGIYELPHELQNDLRLRILVN